MKKFAALIIALVNLGVFIIAAWWLYKSFYSTPVLIANLLLILTGVLLSYTIYNQLSINQKNIIRLIDDDFPTIESGLIYAEINDFCNKYEKNKGILFVAGIDEKITELTLQKVQYQKLTDLLTFTFSPSLTMKLKGVSTIAVGDEQFMIHGFTTCEIKSKETYLFDWSGNQIILKSKNQVEKIVKIPDQKPTLLFDWS